MRTYSGEEIVEAIRAGEMKPQAVLAGLAKVDDEDAGVLLHSSDGCRTWNRIPVDLIERVDHLTTVRCKDHSHPFVRIHLREIEDDPRAAALLDLLRARVAASRTRRRQRDEGPVASPEPDCFWDDAGYWVCCDPPGSANCVPIAVMV